MKRKMISLLLMVITLICFMACGGGKVECSLAGVEETRVVILVEQTDGKGTLLDCMEYLAEKEETFAYKMVGGMLTEINGKANAADFSACWMLYTSDDEMSNTEWGVIEYEGATLGSAVVGAEVLLVEEGEIYVWIYQTF